MGYSIVIPREVDRICSFSFAGAVNLKCVTIPKTVSYIAPDAFRDCRELAAIHCEFGKESIPGAKWGAPDTCKVYFNCYYEDKSGQTEPAQPGGTDTSDATATAADILYPKTAYSKGRKLTGNILTITPYLDGNTVIVPEGYNPEDKEFTLDIPETPSGTDTSDATVTADKLLDGVTAYGANGKVTGNIKTVTASLSDNKVTVPAGHIATAQTLIVAEAAAPTTSGNVVTINKGYQPEQKKVTVGTAQAAKTYVPGTSDQTIPAGTYISGTQTILGDANLNENVIAAGKKLFGKTGIFTADATAEAEDIAEGATAYVNGVKITGTAKASTGGGGSFAKVTEFVAPYDAYSAVSSIEVSGFTTAYNDNYGEDEDVSMYNGTYQVTPATAHETDMLKRVYKHSTEKMYIFHGEEMEYGDGACWFFSRNTSYPSAYNALIYKSGTTLPNGTSSWNKIYSDNITVTLNQVTTNFPAQPLVLNAVSATYDNGAWSYGSAVTLTDYELEPAVDGIYLYDGTKLIGDVVDLHFDKWMPQDGLLMYFPLTETGNTVYDRVKKIRLTKVGSVIQNGINQDNSSDSGGFSGTQNAFSLPKNFTLSVKVNYTGDGSDGDKCVIDFGRGYSGFGIRADLSSDTVKFGLRIGNDSPRQINNIPRDEEHTITFTFEGNTDSDYKDCYAYVDGEERTNMTYEPGSFDQSVMLEILTRYFEETNVWASFPGTIRDVLLYDRVLTDEEIATIANR